MKRNDLTEAKRNFKVNNVPLSLQLPYHLRKKPNLLESSYWKKEFKNILFGKRNSKIQNKMSSQYKNKNYYLKKKFSTSVKNKPIGKENKFKINSNIEKVQTNLIKNFILKTNKQKSIILKKKSNKSLKRMNKMKEKAKKVRLINLKNIKSAADLLVPEERRGVKINLNIKEINSTKESNQVLISSINRKKRLIMESKYNFLIIID